MTRRFYITEVFSDSRYSGNQLATVIDTEGLASEEMQQIARAFNFAETTFYMGGSPAEGFDVRIFTPATELPFAGHPTLGTSYLIKQHIAPFEGSEVRLNLGVGQIPVTFHDDGILWMRQNAAEFGEQLSGQDAAGMIGITADLLDTRAAPQRVSTGLPFLMIPVKNLQALKQARPLGGVYPQGILAFCTEGYEPDHGVAARMFAPDLGVAEDAATGSAAGCLAAYLSRHEILGEPEVATTVGQGFEIGRPSALHIRASNHGNHVEVGGRVNLVAEGVWHL